MSSDSEFDSKIIRIVEQYPHLYDRKSKDYKNTNVTSVTWDIIGKKLHSPGNVIQERWNYLRKRFTQTASHGWRHYNDLLFLEPYIKRRKILKNDVTNSTHGEVIIIEDANESYENDTTPVCPVSKNRSKKRKHMDRNTDSDREVPSVEKNDSFAHASPSERHSVKSFCDSIFSDLLSLEPKEVLSCRIDIMMVIRKYMLKLNDNNENIKDTLMTELMNRFSEVENKIIHHKMPSHDKDWVFISCIKNLFCKLMELQKDNDELSDLLRGFQCLDHSSTPNISSPRKKLLKANFPLDAQCSADSVSLSNDVGDIDSTDIDVKEEVSSSAAKSSTAESVYFEEIKVNEVLPENISILQEYIMTNGISKLSDDIIICNFCNEKIEDADSHVKTHLHTASKEKFCRRYALKTLDSRIFTVENNKLECTVCCYAPYSPYLLKKHVVSSIHRVKMKSTITEAEIEPERNYISKGMLKIGRSFRFCLLCCENVSVYYPHLEERKHQQRLLKNESACKLDEFIYCFPCKRKFTASDYEQHDRRQENLSKHRVYYHKFRKFYGL